MKCIFALLIPSTSITINKRIIKVNFDTSESEKIKVGYGCNEYRNFKSYADTILEERKNILIRIGANKNGFWEIRDNISDKCKDNFINFEK